MKLFWLSIGFLFLSLAGFSQTQTVVDTTKTENHYHITFDLFRAFQGSLQLNIEKPTTKKASICVGLIGTWAQSGGMGSLYLKAQSFDMAVSSNGAKIQNINNTQLKGAGINLKYKMYIGKHPIVMHDLWFGPEVFYRQLSIYGQYNDGAETKMAHKTLFLGYGGYAVGWQKMLFNVICVDAYAGGGFFYSQYSGDTFPTKDKSNYQLDYTGVYLNGSIAIGFAK